MAQVFLTGAPLSEGLCCMRVLSRKTLALVYRLRTVAEPGSLSPGTMDPRAMMLEHSMNIEQGLVVLSGITAETPATSERFVILVRTAGNIFEFCKATGVMSERGVM